jgi:hypothetical protein
MVEFDLDLPEVAAKILAIAKVVDAQAGSGRASFEMFKHLLKNTMTDLREFTHAYEPHGGGVPSYTLRKSWELKYLERMATRGFYNPNGMKAEFGIDPHAEKPTWAANYHDSGGAFDWEENAPIFYHRVEFGRGGDHDAPKLVSLRFDGHFEDALGIFFDVLSSSLGGIDINTSSLGGIEALAAAEKAKVKDVRPIAL